MKKTISGKKRSDSWDRRVDDAYYYPNEFRGSKTKFVGKQGNGLKPILVAVAVGIVCGYFLKNGTLISLGGIPGFPPPVTPGLPQTGVMYTAPTMTKDAIASFKVVGANDGHCVLNLLGWNSKEKLLRLFVRSQESVETNIPLGSYRVTFSCGSSWTEGSEFGLMSPTLRASAPLVTRQDPDGTIWGRTIGLTRRTDGNMRLDPF